MSGKAADLRLRLFDDAGIAALEIPARDRAFSEEEVVDILRQQIAYLLEHRRDWLLGKLYRLDVRERDIKAALAVPQSDTAEDLARLILARQAERSAARLRYGSADTHGDSIPDELVW